MFLKIWEKAILLIILTTAVFSSIIALHSIQGSELNLLLDGGNTLGKIQVRVDSLSSWMILIINFTVLTGFIYGLGYLKPYKKETTNYSIHLGFIAIFHISMILVCMVQHFLGFLAIWEIMAVSSFVLAIMDHEKQGVVKAGLNYLIQSHIGITLLTIGFIWTIGWTGSFDFNALTTFSKAAPTGLTTLLFFILFAGFGFKAGFIPMHTWLPYAHPAAPSHVSAMMSGVMIKMGIYGILRILLLIKGDYLTIGIIILIISLATALYGVMLAIVQHNLKRLLAYHSIENIGIIGIGIGIGTIGMGTGNEALTILGFLGAILHTINHSLFKSLLFYGAGSVYFSSHTLNIEKLGGLIKKMPYTAFLFLIAALAICGLPPFNGFISEFLIYSSIFIGMQSHVLTFSLMFLLSTFSLALVGGLALLCFTKAFGIVFLGSPRVEFSESPKEVSKLMLAPQAAIAAVILFIGLFPGLMLKALTGTVNLFSPSIKPESVIYTQYGDVLQRIGMTGLILIVLFIGLITLKRYATKNKVIETSPTWSCGYVSPNPKLQYTASSFVKTYSNIIKPLLMIRRKPLVIDEIFPSSRSYHSEAYDKVEYLLIDKNLKLLKMLMYKFNFLQNGKLNFYIMYGLIFILLVILISYTELLNMIMSK